MGEMDGIVKAPSQKQSSGGVLSKRRYLKFRKIQKKKSVPETFF